MFQTVIIAICESIKLAMPEYRQLKVDVITKTPSVLGIIETTIINTVNFKQNSHLIQQHFPQIQPRTHQRVNEHDAGGVRHHKDATIVAESYWVHFLVLPRPLLDFTLENLNFILQVQALSDSLEQLRCLTNKPVLHHRESEQVAQCNCNSQSEYTSSVQSGTGCRIVINCSCLIGQLTNPYRFRLASQLPTGYQQIVSCSAL